MNRNAALVIASIFGAVVSLPTAQAMPKPKGYEAFRMVRTRNIFDPERQPGSVASATPTPATTRSDFVALTGIMVTSEKSLAFFSGSRAEFSKVLSVGGAIAGANVTKITPATIEVERAGKLTAVAIGQTVPLDGGAPTAAPAEAGNSSTPAGPESPATSDRAAVLRRMMEKRQQELK